MIDSSLPQHTVQPKTYQTELLQAIFDDSVKDGAAGVSVYQHNLYMTAQRSLSVTYPVVAAMLGEQALYILGRRLLREELPVSGNWADWGYGLVSVLQTSELHAAHPYLSDMAAYEWAFHSASGARCQLLDADSLHCLQTHDPDHIYLQLQPSLRLVCSQYPLYGLWQLHRQSTAGEIPAKAQLEKIMDSEESGCYVLSQGLHSTQAKIASAQEYQWLDGVRQGLSVGALLDAYPALDFATWLSVALQQGWLVRLNVVSRL